MAGGFCSGGDADKLHAQVEEPVEEALELWLAGERSVQLGAAGLTVQRKPVENWRETLAHVTFEDDPARQARHAPRLAASRPPGPGQLFEAQLPALTA